MPLFGPPNIEKYKTQKNVKGMIKALRYKHDVKIRKEAARALGESGDKRAVKPLTFALNDEDPDVRHHTRESLAKLRDPCAVEPIINAYKNSKEQFQSFFRLLVEIGNSSVESLLETLKDPDWEMRKFAVVVLGHVHDLRTVEPLIAMIKDEDHRVRDHAIKALGQIRDPRAVDPLIGVIEDCGRSKGEAYRIRSGSGEAAIKALGEIGDPRAVETIISVIDSFGAIDALAKIGKPAISPLLELLRSSDSKARRQAVRTLGKIKDPQTFDPLIAVLEERDPEITDWVIGALAEIGNERAIEPLIDVLEDRNHEFTMTAIIDLGRIGNKRAIEPLVCFLEDETSPLDQQLEAVKALEKIGLPKDPAISAWHKVLKKDWHGALSLGKVAIKPLVAALRSRELWDRQHAAETLEKIGVPDEKRIQVLVAVAKRNWKGAGKFGKDAVEPLLEVMDVLGPVSGWTHGEIAEVLGDIGDPRALDALSSWCSIHRGSDGEMDLAGAKVIKRAIEKIKNKSSKGN